MLTDRSAQKAQRNRLTFNRNKPIQILFLFLLSLIITACGGGTENSEEQDPALIPGVPSVPTPTPSPEPTPDPTPDANSGYSSTAILTKSLNSSSQCPAGGVEIQTGVDINQNGLLDSNEVNNTQELCHQDFDSVLAEVDTLTPGEECANGGHRLTIGYDADNSEVIDDVEINQTLLFCDRVSTPSLATALYQYNEVEPNGICQYGGHVREVGLDSNGNQALDSDEVTSREYQCTLDLQPISNSTFDFCSNAYCPYQVETEVLVYGLDQYKTVGRVYDDGVGNVELSVDGSAPEWLDASLSERMSFDFWNYENQEYIQAAYYNILVDQSRIPSDAAGNTYPVTFSVSDGTVSLEYERNLKILKPLDFSFDVESLSFTESSENTTQTAYVRVTFDQPLPKEINGASGWRLENSISVFTVDEDEERSYASSSEIAVDWVSTDFFEGQTFATLAVKVFDDYFPEDTETFEVNVKMPTVYDEDYDYLYSLSSSFDVHVMDNGDQAISASISFDSNEVTEGSADIPESLHQDVPFTISFSPELPADVSLRIRLEQVEAPVSNGEPEFIWSDVEGDIGFNCSSNYSYRCSSSTRIELQKGATEYSGVLQVVADKNFEGNEVFWLQIQETSSMALNLTGASISVVDDDSEPLISFNESLLESYATEQTVKAKIDVDYVSSSPIEFIVGSSDSDTAIEGVHYDFGVSTPIVLEAGKKSFELPIIIYGEDFSEEAIEANITLQDVSGAVTEMDSKVLKLSIDKIEPYEATSGDFKIPLSFGSAYSLDSEALFVADDLSVYKVGEINDGAVIDGQSALGDRDLFVAKFKLDGSFLWARQLGTASWDNVGTVRFDGTFGDVFVRSYGEKYHINSSGVVRDLDTEATLSSAKRDSQGNLYMLYSYSNVYSNQADLYDLDGDGSYSNMLLQKYDSDYNLLWVSEDMSGIQADHGAVNLSIYSLVLNDDNVPFVIGGTYSNSLLGKASLGSDDVLSLRISPDTGEVNAYERFGSDAGDNFTSAHAYEGGKVIVHYRPYSTNATVNGETVGPYNRVARVIINEQGVKSFEGLVETSSHSGFSSFFKSSDGKYFSSESSDTEYGYRDIKQFDSLLNLEVSNTIRAYNEPMVQAPVLAEDGGYYFIDQNSSIEKYTPGLNPRTM